MMRAPGCGKLERGKPGHHLLVPRLASRADLAGVGSDKNWASAPVPRGYTNSGIVPSLGKRSWYRMYANFKPKNNFRQELKIQGEFMRSQSFCLSHTISPCSCTLCFFAH